MDVNPIVGQRIGILSPHFDDAVLSLGGYINRATTIGAAVDVITVLGNDPTSSRPATPWERDTGFQDSAAAATARRLEDARACSVLGATQVALPFGDEEHQRGGSDDDVWVRLRSLIEDYDMILVPGFPLRNPDHQWLTRLVLTRRHELSASLLLYVEQPYASSVVLGQSRRAGPSKSILRGLVDLSWIVLQKTVGHSGKTNPRMVSVAGLRATNTELGFRLTDVRSKWRAVRCYRSQRENLGPFLRTRVSLYEYAAGGEAVFTETR